MTHPGVASEEVKSHILNDFETNCLNSSNYIVFFVKIDSTWDDDYKFETALRLLPFRQQKRIISKKFSLDAKTALANQLLQRFISCLVLGIKDPTSLEFTSNRYGKPSIKGDKFTFSMSNQQGFTSMIIDASESPNEVGIDLASVSDVDGYTNTDDLLSHFEDIFHEQELELLKSLPKHQDVRKYFTNYWTLKESYTKKIGVGLNGDLKSYNFKSVGPLPSKFDGSVIEGEYFKVRKSPNWNDETKLYIYDNLEQIDIKSTLLKPGVVVSVCGDSISVPPLIVEISISSIVEFLTT